MSKSFMDAVRQAMNEGAREKTADGMTKDAAHFRHDLHKVQDSGFKHMVQKDSETSDYAKMFSGDVDRAPDRLGDQRAPEDLNKYVEYNEHLEIEEAKKAEKHDEDCDCEDCKDTVKEQVMGGSAPAMAQRASGVDPNRMAKSDFIPPKSRANINLKSAPGTPLNIGRMRGGLGVQSYNSDITRAAKPPAPPVSPAAREPATPKPVVSPAAREPATPKKVTPTGNPKMAGAVNQPVSPAAREPQAPKKITPTGNPKMAGSAAVPPKPQPRPAKPQAAKPVAPKPTAAKPAAPKPTATKPAAPKKLSPLKQQMARSRTGQNEPAGPKRLNQSFEIDIQGASYLVSESQAAAIAAFVEKYGMVDEGTAGEFISKEMKHPEKLTAKGKKQKIKQALAIYYSKKRRGENP